MEPIWDTLYRKALSVLNDRKISDWVEAGGVAAAVEAESGKVYLGVCVDTACTLGICAERNAIFNMITNGEHRIRRVVAVMGNGISGAPCGACRELMVQLMPNDYAGIEFLLDYAGNPENPGDARIVTLGELTPEWWVKND